jgi:outer membrane lipoprotein LolB
LRLGTVALAAALIAGCALAPALPRPTRDTLGDFAVDARFALRATVPGQPAANSGGRLTWEHRGSGDRLLIANPLGIGIAEIDSGPGRATLRTGDGRVREADDPDILIAEVTGQDLPARRLPDWLRGRGDASARISRDAAGRPLRLDEAGWQVDYTYADTSPDALPAGVTLSRADLALILRIETWEALP